MIPLPYGMFFYYADAAYIASAHACWQNKYAYFILPNASQGTKKFCIFAPVKSNH